jgi:hypothetical protein
MYPSAGRCHGGISSPNLTRSEGSSSSDSEFRSSEVGGGRRNVNAAGSASRSPIQVSWVIRLAVWDVQEQACRKLAVYHSTSSFPSCFFSIVPALSRRLLFLDLEATKSPSKPSTIPTRRIPSLKNSCPRTYSSKFFSSLIAPACKGVASLIVYPRGRTAVESDSNVSSFFGLGFLRVDSRDEDWL